MERYYISNLGETAGEWVAGISSAQGIVEVASYTEWVRLVPGDQIVVENERVVGIHRLAERWLFEVYANIPDVNTVAGFDPFEWEAASLAAADLTRQLNSMGDTDSPAGGLVTRFATESRQWFTDAVSNHPHVYFYDTLRTPRTVLDWRSELRHGPKILESHLVSAGA